MLSVVRAVSSHVEGQVGSRAISEEGGVIPCLFLGLHSKLEIKKLPANAGDMGSIPELGRSPAGGNGNPLHYSCLGNPMDRGCWWPYSPYMGSLLANESDTT